jgi:outer membrane protein OmpA-like peptidoglycan-associated protein
MKFHRLFWAFFLIFFVLSLTPLTALDRTIFSIRAGLSSYYPFSSEAQDFISASGLIKGEFDYFLSPKFHLSISMGLGGFTTGDKATEDYWKYIPGTISLSYRVFDKDFYALDLFAGPGGYAIPNETLMSSIGAHLGGRLSYKLNPRNNLYLELVGHDWLEEGAFEWSGTTQLVELSLGITFSKLSPSISAEGTTEYQIEPPPEEKTTVPKTTTSADSDGDGVPDEYDRSPGTPAGVAVDEAGRPLDSDMDGVPDYLDSNANTPLGVVVDAKGNPVDTDEDGIPDYLDREPNTPAGALVDQYGRALDTDGDGVPDYCDQEPNTPKGSVVNSQGYALVKLETGILEGVEFTTGKAILTAESNKALLRLLWGMEFNHLVKIEIRAYCEDVGKPDANLKLTQERAEVIKNFLVKNGILEERITAIGVGAKNFIVPDAKSLINRRIEISIIE